MFQALATSQVAYDAAVLSAMFMPAASASGEFVFQSPVDFYAPPEEGIVSPRSTASLDPSHKLFAPLAEYTFSLSPLSDDDATKPPPDNGAPPAGGGSPPGDAGRPSNAAIFTVPASSALYALQSIRDRYGVVLDEEGLAEALTDYGLIEWVTNESRSVMKSVLSELKEKEDELKVVTEKMGEKESQSRTLERSLASPLGEISALILKGLKSARERKKERLVALKAEVDGLKAQKRDLAPKMQRIPILEEWLSRMARSDYHDGYACITDKGLSVLERMLEDRKKLEEMTFVDYMMSFKR